MPDKLNGRVNDRSNRVNYCFMAGIIARTGNFRRANDEASFQNSEAAGALETAMILRKKRAFSFCECPLGN